MWNMRLETGYLLIKFVSLKLTRVYVCSTDIPFKVLHLITETIPPGFLLCFSKETTIRETQ